jgi:hypothetical protein
MGSTRARTRGSPRTSREQIKTQILSELLGPWAVKPKTPSDKKAAKLARSAMRVSKNGSCIIPAAIGVVDVLGMSKLLDKLSLDEIMARVAEPFFDLEGPAYSYGHASGLTAEDLEKRGFRKTGGFFSTMISDTIVLARPPQWDFPEAVEDFANAEAVIDMARYICKITRVNALHKIYIRSAIAFGDCLISVVGNPVFLGQPVREAFKWEGAQDWIGSMLAPSAVAVLRRAAETARAINGPDFKPNPPDFLVNYDVPLKRKSKLPRSRLHVAINPFSSLALGALDWLKLPVLPKPSRLPADVAKKLRITAEFYHYCRNQGFDSSGVNRALELG